MKEDYDKKFTEFELLKKQVEELLASRAYQEPVL